MPIANFGMMTPAGIPLAVHTSMGVQWLPPPTILRLFGIAVPSPTHLFFVLLTRLRIARLIAVIYVCLPRRVLHWFPPTLLRLYRPPFSPLTPHAVLTTAKAMLLSPTVMVVTVQYNSTTVVAPPRLSTYRLPFIAGSSTVKPLYLPARPIVPALGLAHNCPAASNASVMPLPPNQRRALLPLILTAAPSAPLKQRRVPPAALRVPPPAHPALSPRLRRRLIPPLSTLLALPPLLPSRRVLPILLNPLNRPLVTSML